MTMPPRTGSGPGPDNSRVGTMVFLMAGSMFFAGLIGAYVVLRYGGPVWPPPGMPLLPVGLAGASTAAIALSSLALWRAIRALRGLDAPGTRRWLGVGAGLGLLFLALQTAQWSRLLARGLDFAVTTYGTTFYAITGVHALHAVSGILWLLVLVWRQREHWVPERRRRSIEAGALYWHFVGAVWVLIYVVLYLL